MSAGRWMRGLDSGAFLLLAPPAEIPACYTNVHRDDSCYRAWLSRAQQLRGATYLADGAISAQDLTAAGELVSDWDRRSWHIVARDGDKACATMRFTFHTRPVAPDKMALAHSGLFRDAVGPRAWRAIVEFQTACLDALDVFGEVGGWAADFSRRGGRRSAAVALSAWPVCRSIGRVRAISTVTERNQSIAILSRIAAAPLQDEAGAIPSWLDAEYGCRMHLSAFNTWDLSDEFEDDVHCLSTILYSAPVYAPHSPTEDCE